MDTHLLEIFFAGKADQKQKSQIVAWAMASEENSRQFIETKTDWTLRNFPNEPADADDFLRFSKYEITKSNEPQDIEMGLGKKNILSRIYRIAAIIAIPLLFVSVFQQIRLSQIREQERNLQAAKAAIVLPEQTQTLLKYAVNPGVKGKVVLPDGSEVWLNSNSVLHSPNLFDSVNRIVRLEGEGYFKIKSTEDWPFYIQTEKGVTVKVTGTEFNLSSYANDPFLKITMVEGRLMLIDDASLQTISLRPMEELVLQNDQFEQIARSRAKKMEEDVAWREGYLMFESTPMDAIIRRMERWYGVSITVNDPNILNFRITAKFDNESLTQVLDIFKLSSNIKYRINGNRVVLSL